jgi:hypothetical protein
MTRGSWGCGGRTGTAGLGGGRGDPVLTWSISGRNGWMRAQRRVSPRRSERSRGAREGEAGGLSPFARSLSLALSLFIPPPPPPPTGAREDRRSRPPEHVVMTGARDSAERNRSSIGSDSALAHMPEVMRGTVTASFSTALTCGLVLGQGTPSA